MEYRPGEHQHLTGPPQFALDKEKSKITGKLVRAYKKDGQQWGVIEMRVEIAIAPNGKSTPLTGTISTDITIDTAIDGSVNAGTIKMNLNGNISSTDPKSRRNQGIDRGDAGDNRHAGEVRETVNPRDIGKPGRPRNNQFALHRTCQFGIARHSLIRVVDDGPLGGLVPHCRDRGGGLSRHCRGRRPPFLVNVTPPPPQVFDPTLPQVNPLAQRLGLTPTIELPVVVAPAVSCACRGY